MKRTLLLAWILSGAIASAQVVLEPEAVGSVRMQRGAFTSTRYTLFPEWLWVSALSSPAMSFTYSCNGILEFNAHHTAGGNPFPTENMTAYNWNAVLSGFMVDTYIAPNLDIELYDMADSAEDGRVTVEDFSSGTESLGKLAEGTTTGLTIHQPFDVTETLRRDLFGPGSGGTVSGFVLQPGGPRWGYVGFDPSLPRITVSMGTPPPATPTPVPPTPAATSTVQPGVELFMPDNFLEAGERFRLRAYCRGEPGDASADLYVCLDAFGALHFWPEWTETVQCRRIPLFPERVCPVFVLDFIWPEGDLGHAVPLKFRGILTRPGTGECIGDMDIVAFGY